MTPARSQASQEYLVKAAFIYNFAKFVEWPAAAFRRADSPLTLCVVGEDPFADALDSIDGKTVKGRALTIRRAPPLQDVGSCQILFVGLRDHTRIRNVIEALQHDPVLTISDLDSFTQVGGMINFLTEHNKVRFAINVDAAQRARLQISSRLLNLAKIVSDNPS